MRELEVGEQIVIDNGSRSEYAQRYSVRTITKITKTQLTTDDGKRYSRRTGDQVGYMGMYKPYIAFTGMFDDSPYDYMTIEEAERRNAAAVERAKLARKRSALRNLSWRNVPDDVVDDIHRRLVECGVIKEQEE